MKEVIELKVKARSWTFNEISNLMVTIESLSNEIYSEMNLIERFDMIKETKINDSMVGYYYSDVLREMCLTHIKAEVAGTIKNMLNTATVNFGSSGNQGFISYTNGSLDYIGSSASINMPSIYGTFIQFGDGTGTGGHSGMVATQYDDQFFSFSAEI